MANRSMYRKFESNPPTRAEVHHAEILAALAEKQYELEQLKVFAKSMMERAAQASTLLVQMVRSLAPETLTVYIPADDIRPAEVDDVLAVSVEEGDLVLRVTKTEDTPVQNAGQTAPQQEPVGG